MASIADLTVDLKLLTASFEASAKKTQQQVSAMRTSFEGLRGQLETVGKGFAALGIGIGLRELISVGREALESAGGLGELAQQIGISVQALQALQFSGAQAGISQDEMNTAVARLTKTIGDAVAGSKQAVDAFNALGVGVLDSTGKTRNVEAIFVSVAQALLGIPDPAKRAAAEVDIFGRAGQRLETVLQDVAGGFTSMIKASSDAGAQLSDQTVAAADKAADGLSRLGLRLQRAKENFATLVAGPIADFLDAIDRLNKNTDLNVTTAVRQSDLDQAQRTLAVLEQQAEHLREQIEQASKTPIINPLLADWAKRDLDQLNAKLRETEALIQRQQGAVSGARQGPFAPHPFSGDLSGAAALGTPAKNPPVAGAADAAAKKIKEVIDALSLQRDNLARTDAEQEVYNNLARAGVAINTAAGQQIASLTNQITAQKAALEATNTLEELRLQKLSQQDEALAASFQAKRQMTDQAAERATSIQQEITDNQSLITALEEGSHAYEVQTQLLQILNQARAAGAPLVGAEIDQARQQAETLVNQGERLQQLQANAQAAETAINDIGTAFINGIAGIQTWADVAKQALADVLKLLLQIIAQQAAASLAKSGGGILGSLIGSLFGAVAGGVTGGGPGKIELPGVRAKGGPVTAGSPYIVGEQGPELFVPGGGGTVLPNDFAFAGGMTVVQHNSYDLRGTDISRAELEHKIAKSQRETYGAVFKAMDSGGREAKSSGRRRR